MCQIAVKYEYASRAVCAYAHIFRKRRGCALIGACALIRMNTVILIENKQDGKQQKGVIRFLTCCSNLSVNFCFLLDFMLSFYS